jgi:hypothetical protein
MTSTPPARVQRLIAIGLLGASLALFWFALASPIADYIDAHAEQRGISLRALRRDRALLQEAPAVQAALSSVDRNVHWQSLYESPEPEATAVQLEADLRALLKSTGNPTSMTVVPPVARGPVTRIGVKVSMSMRVDQLAQTLELLQRQPKRLQIESLIIQSPDFQPADTNPMLTIQAEIVGFMVAANDRRK